MAEGIAQKIFSQMGLPVNVESYGMLDMPGNAPAREAIAICLEHGIDISGHRAQKLTRSAAQHADLILTMERRHIEWICEAIGPEIAQKAYLITDYGNLTPSNREIPDPIGEPEHAYAEIFRLLRDEIMRIANTEKHAIGG